MTPRNRPAAYARAERRRRERVTPTPRRVAGQLRKLTRADRLTKAARNARRGRNPKEATNGH